MFGLDPVVVAFVFIGLGISLAILVQLILRSSRVSVGNAAAPHPNNTVDDPDTAGGVLLIGPGGRILSANQTIRNWLNLSQDALPNLEHIARRTSPSDAFLELCSAPGSRSISLQGMLMDAASYAITGEAETQVLVTLQRVDITPLSRENNSDTSALNIISELGILMTSNSDLPSTVKSILVSVERLIPADIAEITIWQAEENHLVPYRLIGPPGLDRKLDTPETRYRPGEGYTGKLFQNLKPLVITPNNRPNGSAAEAESKTYPFKSYLGVPLMMGEVPIGTLELGSLTSFEYTDKDLETLTLLSNQAAVALNHAITRREEEQRVAELTGLANIVQAVGALHEPHELFTHLVNSIQPLVDVEVLGFLIYDNNSQQLQGQAPFIGVPDHFISLYRATFAPDSPAEKIWLGQKTLTAHDAENDPQLHDLGLAPFVQASGIRSTVLVPLLIGGEALGYLQAANKRNKSAFTSDELRILNIVAGQSAVILKNAKLLTEARRRTVQAEALRRISALAGSAVTLDEILLFSLTEIARLVGADIAAIYLLDQDQSELTLHADSLYGAALDTLNTVRSFKLEDPLFARSNTALSRVSVFNLHTPELENEEFYKPIFEAFNIQSALSVPLTVSERTVGEIMLGSQELDFFHQGEVGITSNAAGQLAGAIDRMMSASRSDDILRARIDHLTMLNRIARELNEAATPQALLQVAHREALRVTGADCGTVYWLSKTQDRFEIKALEDDHSDTPPTRLSKHELVSLRNAAPHIARSFEDHYGDPPHGGVDAMLFLPLTADGNVIGLISLHSYDPNAFDEAGLELSASFAAQVSLALRNAHRTVPAGKNGTPATAPAPHVHPTEHSDRGLAFMELIYDISNQVSRAEIFSSLSQNLLDRLGFDICLIAEASAKGAVLTQVLGELPRNIHPEVLLGQRNPLRQSLRTGETYTQSGSHADSDHHWKDSLLLKKLDARAFISLPFRTTSSGDQVDAAVLALSRREIPLLNKEEHEIIGLLGRQLSASFQSVDLIRETERRIREVDLLLNFNRRLGTLNTPEILGSLLDNTLNLLPAVQATQILLWDEVTERLVPFSVTGYRNNETMMSLHWLPGEGLPGLTFSEGKARRVAEVNIANDYNLPYEKLLAYQQATKGYVPIASLIVPIPTSTANIGVFVLDNFSSPDVFSHEDEQLISSLARQTGLVLENARLLEEANERTVQLEALTKVSTTITSDLQVELITESLLDNLHEILPFDTGTFWFRQGDILAIRATRGFDGDEDRVGLTVHIQDSKLLSDMIAESRPVLVNNVTHDERFVLPSEFTQLSWLGIPLITKGQVVGVIALEKTEETFYTQEHIQLATTFAGQAAVALENARLFEESIQRAFELNERSQRLDLLNRLSTELSSSLDPEQILGFTVEEIRKAISCNAVSAILVQDDLHAELVAQSPSVITPLPQGFDISPFGSLRESLGVRIISNTYADPALQALDEYWKKMGTQSALVLSIATSNELHGLLILHSHERLRASEVDLARTITNQVAVAVQNAKLFHESRRLTEDLEARVELRTRELEREHIRTNTLLDIITELSASLDMDIVLNRTLAIINRIAGAEHSIVILANPADTSLLRRASHGYTTPVPEGGALTDLELDEGLAGWVIENREAALIDDILEDERWVPRGDTQHRSTMAIPLMLGAEALGALMLFHREIGKFSPDLLDLISAAAKQIAVAVNNAQLYLLIRDQAERLGGMLRSQQVEASRLRAILEAVADGILVTNARGQISIFNHSAEQILGLDHENTIDRSLDYFTGLFGKAGQQWMETIRTWSADPHDFDADETFFEQIELDNKHIVAVNLAPVYSAREFMGTVSIFRDITHLVEVDRMKSEFVATVSHELRTPMTSIKGYVDVMLMGAAGELSDQQQNFLGVVKTNTERLNILVNDLLEVSRIEAGKIHLNMLSLDLPALANDVSADFLLRSKEDEKALEINVRTPRRLPQAQGDPDRVRQILTNLVGNAYNYTPRGGKIEVSFIASDNMIRVAVKDTGVGIPPEEQSRIFERFYRGEAPLVSSVAGTGLGLSIVKYFVTLHGGEIWVESRGVPGEGSTFYFTLPKYK